MADERVWNCADAPSVLREGHAAAAEVIASFVI
jgi:hypothetical protein